MIQRSRLTIAPIAVLLTFGGCGGGGGDGVAPESIRIPTLGAPTGDGPDEMPSGEGVPVDDAAEGDAVPDGAVREDGAAPGEGSASPSAPAPVADVTPLPAGVDERLRGVFEIANGEAIEFAVAVARRLIDVEIGPRAGFAQSRTGTDAGTGVRDWTLLCPEGGTLDVTSSSLLSSEGRYTLRECDVGALVLNGAIAGRVRGPERETDGVEVAEPDYEFDDFSVRDSRSGRTIVLAAAKIRPTGREKAPAIRFGYGVTSAYGPSATIGPGAVFDERADRTLVAFAPVVTRTVSNPTTDFPLGGMTTSFELRFGAEPVRVTVATVVPFDGLDPEGRFARGSLTVVSEEGGYAYTLDAESGDPATFRLDVVEGGATTSYLVPWSDAIGFDAFEPENVDVGF